METDFAGYSPDGTRSDDAPAGWPFGRLDPIQQRNHDRARAAARALNEQRRQELIAALIAECGEARAAASAAARREQADDLRAMLSAYEAAPGCVGVPVIAEGAA